MAVPLEQWGKDHWSTFAYIETRCHAYRGWPDRSHMRTDPDLHPGLAHRGSFGEKYPTQIKGGKELFDHDDWSCLDDAEELGFLKNIGSGINRVYKLTDLGMMVANALRNHKAEGGTFTNFSYEIPEPFPTEA